MKTEEAEKELGRKLTADERAAVEKGAVVIGGKIVESSTGGKVEGVRK